MRFKRILAGLLSVMMLSSAMVMTAQAVTNNDQSTGAYTNRYDNYATYNGSDLGANYSANSTTFKVWAPTASKVQVKLYNTGSDSEAGAGVISTTDMTKDNSTGVWSITIDGDLHKVYYTYLVTVNGNTEETQDVYSVATGVNGERSMVVDLDQTDPEGWVEGQHVLFDNPTDSVVWEVQIRDFSIDDSSGVSDANQGKYLAFTESGTKLNGTDDIATCVDYLVEQGVNAVHLNPAYDFGSVDETKLDTPQYNWGYDPINYNVPEGSFSSDPYNGEVRIEEFKAMVQALHDRGISVIMDVVYNHTYSTDSSFQNTVPNYYYRMDGSTFLNGSGCGNVMATDKTMYRNYVIDSVEYWANEYNIDGFRFDLMGCMDITTMNEIRDALDEIDSRILVYGEPWMADWGGGNGISDSEACIMANASKVDDRISMFSDKIRNALKGGTNDASKGYINGLTTVTYDVIAGMMGGASTTFGAWSQSPSQTITYNSAHDNLTLWDKIVMANGGRDYDTTNASYIDQNKLSAAIVLTSQGMPFYLAGEEFARTKYGDHNSYMSPDSINKMDWTRVETYNELVQYYKGLMEIRANYSPMRDGGMTSINGSWVETNGSAIGYTLQNKLPNASNEWGTVAVLTNNNSTSKTVTLKSQTTLPSSWVVVANGDSAGLESLGTISGSSITIPPMTAMVLVDASTYDRLVVEETEFKTITVNHIDSATEEILKTTTSKYEVGSTYRTQADTDILFDYNLDRVEGLASGTVTQDATVNYYYTSDGTESYTLTVKYLSQSGLALAEETTQKLKDGSDYSEEHKTITGYELDTTKLPNNTSGSISANTTITYVYKETLTDPLKVHYYNSNNWSTPHMYTYDDSNPTVELLTGEWPGSPMTSEGNNWYTYNELSVAQAKVMFTNGAASSTEQDPGQNQPGYAASGEVWIQNGEIAFNSKVVVSYINTAGEKIADDVIIEGSRVTSKDTYATEGILEEGEPVAILGKATGSWSVNTENVVYIYDAGPVGATYILGDANADEKISLADVLDIQKHIGEISILDGIKLFGADVDGSATVTVVDALNIQKYLGQIPTGFDIGEIKTLF